MTPFLQRRAWRLGLAALWLLPAGCGDSAPQSGPVVPTKVAPKPIAKGSNSLEKGSEVAEVAVPPRPAPDALRPGALRPGAASARDGTPKTPDWDLQPDPRPASESFALPSGTSFPITPLGRVLYPSTPSPFIAIGANDRDRGGREVWDLGTLKLVGSLRGKVGDAATSFQLSPDGKYIAARAGESSGVEIYSVSSGKRVRIIELKPKPDRILVFDFAAPGQFLLVADLQPTGKSLHVVDVVTGRVVRSQNVPGTLQENSFAFSPNRRYFAYAADKTIAVHETASGRAVGILPAPGPVAYALAFSPNGKEMAGLFPDGRAGRLVVWDVLKGTMAVDHRIPGAPEFRVADVAYVSGPRMDWLPNGKAWLIGGHALVDRQNGQWLWSFIGPTGVGGEKSNALDLGIRLIDNDRALAVVASQDGRRRLDVITLPWPAIEASLKALRSGAPALLKPGVAISVKYEIGNLRGSKPQAVQEEMDRAVSEGLAGQGLKLADGQALVLRVRHHEEAGPPYPPSSGGKSTFTSTRFICEVALTVDDSASPVWTDRWETTGARRFVMNQNDALSDDLLRRKGFDSYLKDLEELVLPSFIPSPKDHELSMLPGETSVADPPVRRTGTTSKPIERANPPSGPANPSPTSPRPASSKKD